MSELNREESVPDQKDKQRLAFIAAVREGLADVERGDIFPLEQIERELAGWAAEETAP